MRIKNMITQGVSTISPYFLLGNILLGAIMKNTFYLIIKY